MTFYQILQFFDDLLQLAIYGCLFGTVVLVGVGCVLLVMFL
jgi:hypothetical protein